MSMKDKLSKSKNDNIRIEEDVIMALSLLNRLRMKDDKFVIYLFETAIQALIDSLSSEQFRYVEKIITKKKENDPAP